MIRFSEGRLSYLAHQIVATLRREGAYVALSLPAPPDAEALLDAVFVVDPARDVVPGLARARQLLAAQGGSLALEQGRLVARLPGVA